MRKLLFLFSLTFLSLNSFAQTDQGSIMLGGELDFSKSDDVTSFTMTPMFGYFIVDNFVVGSLLSVETNSAFNQFGIAPFTRYYFMVADNLGIYGQGSLAFLRTKTKKDEIKTNGLEVGLDVGLAVFVNDNVSIEPHFGVGVGVGDKKGVIFGIGVGVQAYLSK